jgi:hypothetical protein
MINRYIKNDDMLFADRIEQMLQWQLIVTLEMDTPMYSKIEHSERLVKWNMPIKYQA